MPDGIVRFLSFFFLANWEKLNADWLYFYIENVVEKTFTFLFVVAVIRCCCCWCSHLNDVIMKEKINYHSLRQGDIMSLQGLPGEIFLKYEWMNESMNRIEH